MAIVIVVTSLDQKYIDWATAAASAHPSISVRHEPTHENPPIAYVLMPDGDKVSVGNPATPLKFAVRVLNIIQDEEGL